MKHRITIALAAAALVSPAVAQQPAQRRGFGPFARPAAPPPGALPDDLTPGFKLIDGDIQVPIDFDPRVDGLYATNPWGGGVVPYEFNANVPAADRARAIAAFAQWTALSNVVFVVRTVQVNYVHIQLSTGNSSAVGMVGGPQNLNIAANQPVSVIAHEVGHLLGLFHEHQRPDRDAFVQINQGNVQTAHWSSNYPVVSAGVFGPYDFGSLMHYDRCAFSIGCCAGCTCVCTTNQQTITVLQPFTAQWQNMIGTATGPSYFDGIIARGFYPFTGDRWIDAAYVGVQNGTFVQPWNDTFNAGFGFTPVNGTLLMKPGYYSGVGVYSVPKTILAPAGGVTIGS